MNFLYKTKQAIAKEFAIAASAWWILFLFVVLIPKARAEGNAPKLTTNNEQLTTVKGTTPEKADQRILDSLFVVEYSTRLGIELDTNCDKKLIANVTDWLGTPYRGGGHTRMGTDCSGFVSSVFSEVYDLNLSHSGGAMYYQMKEYVKKSDLYEGDILFFKIHSRGVSHVALYLGNNKFIHSASKVGIRVDDLRAAYYSRYFIGGGRAF